LTRRGCEILRRHYARAKKLFDGKSFQRAKAFQKAYLTDLLQDMASLGVPIHCEIIGSAWKEIDTLEDFEKAVNAFKQKAELRGIKK
jgi:NDP-sugar pyrophosphorylase family protein